MCALTDESKRTKQHNLNSQNAGRGAADPKGALGLWGLHDAQMTRAVRGLNNRSWFIDAPTERYVLRLYSTGSQQEGASEHDFLRQLRSAGLPFATPRSVAARDGSTCPLIPGTSTVAALFEGIDGNHVDDDDLVAIEAAGAAFAELDKVLATLHTARGAWDDGNINSVHPLVRDLSSLDEIGAQCADFVRRMASAPSELRATIEPRQVIHGDFAFGNVLVKDGRVVGVLDLEFVAEDARAAELATALRLALSKGSRESIWRALLHGYLTHLALTDREVDALPTLAMQHEAVIVAWWLGRYRSGMADYQSLREHIERALRLEQWIEAHRREVIDYGRACRLQKGS